MLSAKHKRDIVRQAISRGFPLEQIPLPKLVGDVDRYIQSGLLNPKDKLYQFVPEEFKL
jgi:hypothetical protein